MRITGGEACNRSLASPRSLDVRPLLARVRRSLFDILADRIIGAEILDLYAGVGTIGLEALSRGAKQCYFIEHNPGIASYLTKNVGKLDYSAKTDLLVTDVAKGIALLIKKPHQFDLVFSDPPYKAKGAWDDIAKLPLLMKPDAMLVVHVAARDAPEPSEIWYLERAHRVGDALLYFMVAS